MSQFIKRALEKLPRLEKTQIQDLVGALVGENELLEMAFTSISLGIVVCDQESRILLVNKAAERLIPLAPIDHQDRSLVSIIQDEDIAQFLKKALDQQDTAASREFVLDKNGQSRYVLLSLVPLVKEGRIVGSIVQISDISEKKSRETRLRRAESLASLTTLAAGVAHEIKNPLGSIGIHLQLTQKNLAARGMDDEGLNHYLDVIQEEVDRLNGIVVDFLFAVRPMDTTLVEGSLNRLLKDLTDFLTEEMRLSGVELQLELDTQEILIPIDERFLKQAFLNLIKNSQYAMPQGGIIVLSTQSNKDSLVVSIMDTGVGIPKENLEKIFEPYFTTRDFGSGLGLTLVYKIIKEHGAEIQVLSKERVGTTVRITFPRPQTQRALLEHGGNYQ